ncbi:MAG: hypothetical protein ACHQET_11875 [Chitinophagales bacterium]
MIKALELKADDIQELTRDQLSQVSGGGIISTLLEGTLGRAIALVGVADALLDFGKGVIDGLKGK